MAPGPRAWAHAERLALGLRAHAGVLVLAVAAVVLLARLGDPPSGYHRPGDGPTYVYDEVYQAFTAGRWAAGDRQAFGWHDRAATEAFAKADMNEYTAYEWVHPPGAKLVMAFGMRHFGQTPAAARVGSVIFGLLTLVVVWRLASRWRGAAFGAFAAALLVTDGMWFSLSRLAMADVYVTCGLALALAALYRYWTEPEARARWLVGAGAAFGLAMAMKWSALPVWLGAGALALGRVGWDGVTGRVRGRALAGHAGAWALGFLVLPVVIYVAAYYPFFAAGHDLGDLVALQRRMITYHDTLRATHDRTSSWWTWPLMTRPVWAFQHVGPEPGTVRLVYLMGNPLLWWSFVPALGWIAVRFARLRQAADGVILVGFLGTWLPWALVARPAFLQYLLPAVPFGVLAIAVSVDDAARALGERRGPWLRGGVLVLSAGLFLFFYPIWSAWPVSEAAAAGDRWFWLDSWR